MANSVDPDQTALFGVHAVPSIPNWSVKLGNYLQQRTSVDIFRFFSWRFKG